MWKVLVLTLAIVLTGCMGDTVRSNIDPEDSVVMDLEPPKIRLIYPRPGEISLNDVRFSAVSEEDRQLMEVFLLENGAGLCLAPEEYEDLGLNIAIITAYIESLQSLLDKYELERAEENLKIEEDLLEGPKRP